MIRIKKQTNNIDTKTPNYLKSLSQESKDLIDEMEDANDDINIYKLAFIGSNQKNFNFNTFRVPLDFISVIYNGEISLKETKCFQKNWEDKIKELRFNYPSKDKKEKKEINGVLMQANDLLEYSDKIINAFKNGTFSSEYLKKWDDAANNYVLEVVNKSIEEIKSIEGKINLNLFEEFFESSSPASWLCKNAY